MPPKARPNPGAPDKKKAAPRKKRADRDAIPVKQPRKGKVLVPAEAFDAVATGAKLLGMPAPAAEPRKSQVLTSTVPLANELSPKERAEAMARAERDTGPEVAAEIENVEAQDPPEPLGSPSSKNRRVHMDTPGRFRKISEGHLPIADFIEVKGPGAQIDQMLNPPDPDDPEGVSLLADAADAVTGEKMKAEIDLVKAFVPAYQPIKPTPKPSSVLCVIIPPGASCSISTGADGSVTIDTTGSVTLA